LRGFLVSDVCVIFGTAVMARRTGRRDRGVRRIPFAVADSGARVAGGGRRPECGWCRRDSRHARRGWEREKTTRVSKVVIELSGKVLKTHVI
jgi:hypothetical protein